MKRIFAILIIVLTFLSCYKPERVYSQDFDMYYWRSSLEDLQISPNTFKAVPYIFETIPINDFTFNIRDIVIEKNKTSETIIIILGWSRDGKILLLKKDVLNESYLIVDLVNSSSLDFDIKDIPGIDLDRSNFSSFDNESDVGGKILYNSIFKYPLINLSTIPSEAKEKVFDIAKQYNIESVIGEIGMFPYNGIENTIYDIIMFPEEDHGYLKIPTYIYRKIRPENKKIIKYLGGLYSLRDWYINNMVFLYAVSPYENRIAVITITPYGNVEIEPIPYQIGISGINLNNEF